MANQFFPKGKEKILQGAINFSADVIKVAVLSNAYSFSSAHEFYSDIASYAFGTPQPLLNKSVANGVFDADDITFTDVPPGTNVTALAFYKDTGASATSPLLIFADSVVGFPFTANGGNLTIMWDNGAYRIFSL